MSRNFLPPQHISQNSQEQPGRRTGLLSGGYANQPPGQQLPAPAARSAPPTSINQQPPQNMRRPPLGNVPGAFGPQGQLPPPQPQQWNGPAFMARPMQMVQRWSAKLSAMRRPEPQVDPYPLVRYRGPQPPAPPGARPPRPVPTRPERWQRSRTQKITHMMRKRRERWSHSGPNRKRVGRIIASVIASLLLLTLVIGGYSSYAYYQNQLPQLQGLANLQIEQSTRFYDRNGNLLYTLYDPYVGRSTPVSYTQIPGYLQDAQIAAEDKTFWQNTGVDFQAILRSAFIDAKAQSAQTGASTLTQQVIKNLIDNEPANKKLLEEGQSPDRSIQRKITEAALAIGLTQQFPKWKILEMYFNISPYGAQEQGVEAAAQDFFGLKPKCDASFHCIPAITYLDRDTSAGKCKNPNDDSTCPIDPILGLARASLLASIPQNPVIYDPTVHPEFYNMLLARQDYTLHQMESAQMRINLGLGAHTDYAQANGQQIEINDAVISQVESISKNFKFVGFQGYEKAPHFVQWVIQTLANQLGHGQDIDPNTGISISGYNMLLTGGFNVETTLDSNLQTYVENAIKRHITQPEYQPFLSVTTTLSQTDNLHDSAAVVMDAKTGEVLAMDGTVNYNDKSYAGAGQINMALEPRQPGSAFKPIVIAAAYQMGWYPGIVLPDHKTYFPAGYSQSLPVSDKTTYLPHDYGGGYSGRNTNIEQAISDSYNIPALKAEYYAGLQNVYNMAARLGITTIDPKKDLVNSMALGTDAVPLIEMVGAYQTFANQGVRVPPQGILGIWDNYGHQLYQYNPSKAGTRVLSPQIAYLVTSTLTNEQDRFPEFKNDHVLSMWDWPQPGGGFPDVAAKTGTTDSFKDNWTLGYTPDVVVGVWSGNANDAPMENSIGVTGAAPIWHSIIEYASGKCNTNGTAGDNYLDADQVPCPPLDLHYTDRYFSVPDGIVQQQVNTVNGLAGAGYTSYMLSADQPQQSGLNACPTNGMGGNNGGNGSGTCNGNGGGNGNGTQNP